MRFFSYFFMTLTISFLIWVAIVSGQVNKPTKMSQWVYDAYLKKTRIANKIKTKKIIIVAGSNALFGIDSKLLSVAFSRPVVNFGVNAGVMLPCILHRAKQVINEGDLVILPLEYPLYSYDGVPNAQMIDFVFSRDMDLFFDLTLKEQFLMVWDITFKRLLEGYTNKDAKPVTSGLYGTHNINKFGDQKNTSKIFRNKNMLRDLNAIEPNNYGETYKNKSLGWKYLKKFVTWCNKKGVEIVFTPATMMFFNSYKNNKHERWFYENISKEVEKKGWKYAGNPYSYMYDKSMYLNTEFHLINQGREKRTEQMISDLTKVLTN